MTESDETIEAHIRVETAYELALEAGLLCMIASDLLKDAAFVMQKHASITNAETKATIEQLVFHTKHVATIYRELAVADEAYDPIDSVLTGSMRLAGAVKRIHQVASMMPDVGDDETYASVLFRELDRQHAALVAQRDAVR